MFVVLLAMVALGERPRKRFYLWGAVALVAGLVLSFPDLSFDFLTLSGGQSFRGALLALGASGLWAISTVASKILLRKTAPAVATFWRFSFALVTLIALFAVSGNSIPWETASQWPVLRAVIYMSLFPGLIAMVFYYAGIKRTTASVATFVELLFPIGAVALNSVFLGMRLSPVQLAAGLVLLLAVTMISGHGPKPRRLVT